MANGRNGKVDSWGVCEGFPIVGIGASASGVSAFEDFFSGMVADSDPGMAFVLVQHLLPDHNSILGDLIGRHTRMRVCEVRDGTVVRPNCAYIIPPGREMAFVDGRLQLLEPCAPRGARLPIDFFFRSLAQDLRQRAIGIVLSGSGSDGALGVRAIKGEGGMVMVQDPASAEYDAMPRNALATGLVDYRLPPAQMPAQLLAYTAHTFSQTQSPPALVQARAPSPVEKIFVLVRAQTGHDLSQYRSSTIRQHMEALMAFHRIEGMEGYLEYLKQNPPEMDALLHYLLIGATGFFRDQEAFRALETEVVPRLFADKPEQGLVRVWSPGCATGEEACSLAILLSERQEALKRRPGFRIYATDIDSRAIARARTGIYPAGIAAEVSSQRLARFFSAEPDGSSFRIRKALRDQLLFCEHDAIKDPPFSKLDLICCRNLLINLDSQLHKKLIGLLHQALNPGGFLFLDASETVGELGDLFEIHNHRFKIFQRKPDRRPIRYAALASMQPTLSAPDAGVVPGRSAAGAAGELSLRELTEQALLQQVVAAAALVSGNGDILYQHGRTGLYLEPAHGETGMDNIFEMAREGLRRHLCLALQRAVTGREIVRIADLRVRTNGGEVTAANLTVTPVGSGLAGDRETPLYLVVFEQVPHTGKADEQAGVSVLEGRLPGASDTDLDSRIAAIEQQLLTLEHRVVNREAGRGWRVLRAVSILDNAREVVEWLGTARDVTVRRKADEMRARERTHCT